VTLTDGQTDRQMDRRQWPIIPKADHTVRHGGRLQYDQLIKVSVLLAYAFWQKSRWQTEDQLKCLALA